MFNDGPQCTIQFAGCHSRLHWIAFNCYGLHLIAIGCNGLQFDCKKAFHCRGVACFSAILQSNAAKTRRSWCSMLEYDEDTEMTRYIWDNYSQLMTDFERRVGLAILGRTKAAASKNHPHSARILDERWGRKGDSDIDAALAEGAEAFRRRVANRILTEHQDAVIMNRCPSCGRIARTPQARQCFWCGLDWHKVIS